MSAPDEAAENATSGLVESATSGLVELNVGGRVFTTTRQTCAKSGFLDALSRGSWTAPRDGDGRIFVDRDAGPAFDALLSWCRGGLARTTLDRMDLTSRAALVAEAQFFQVPDLVESAVLPYVGAVVRYSSRAPAPSFASRRGPHVLSRGRVVGYDAARRTWSVEVVEEGVIQMQGTVPTELSPLSAPRVDVFSWPERDFECAASYVLMPWQHQKTTDGRSLQPFGPAPTFGWQFLTQWGAWVDGDAVPLHASAGDASFWDRAMRGLALDAPTAAEEHAARPQVRFAEPPAVEPLRFFPAGAGVGAI